MTLPLGIFSVIGSKLESISGRGRGGKYIRGLPSSLSCKEKALLCPHQTSCGQPLGLSILHHPSANSMLIGLHTSILPLTTLLLATWMNYGFFFLVFISRWFQQRAAAQSMYLSLLWHFPGQSVSPDVWAWLWASWVSTLRWHARDTKQWILNSGKGKR